MNEDQAPLAYVLHTRSFRETSQLVDFLRAKAGASGWLRGERAGQGLGRSPVFHYVPFRVISLSGGAEMI